MSLSASEWQVMRVVWAQGALPSSAIITSLQDKFNWSPSTIKTLLGRLVDKGALQTERHGRQYIYSPILAEEASYQEEVRQAFDKICQRKHLPLFLSILTDLPMTASDIAAVEALLCSKKEQVVDIVPCNCLPSQCTCEKEVQHG
ncbi:CopY/TcrY family copper transport repressor [Streptococcus sp. E17BB]|uniref:CopY/TcrY family copper transport repressor n=1 Tax=Streptococcus sp. E17BB TaxID=3278714 RepID=UPI00359E957D